METATFDPKTLQPNQVNIGTLQNPNIVTSVPSKIKATNLSNGTTPFVDPVTSTTANTKLATSIDTTLGTLSQVTTPSTPDTTAKDTRASVLERISSAIGLIGNKGARTAELQKEQQVNEKKTAATTLENTIIAKSRAYDKQIEQIRQNAGGMFGGAVEQKIAEVERQKNSELADLSIQYKIANGAYVDAVNLVNDAVEAEFSPLKDQIASLSNLYGLYQNDLTESEKMQVQARIQAQQNDVQFKQQMARDAMLQKYQLNEIAYREGFNGAQDQLKPLSGDVAKVFSIATTMQPEIERLKALFASDYKKTIAGAKLGLNRDTVKLVNNIADKVGRLRSGGAINKEEEKRFKQQILSGGDLATGSAEGAIAALDGILNEASIVVQGIDPYGSRTRSLTTQQGTATGAPANTVLMVGPDGKEYHVPNDQVDSFIKDGGKRK